MEQRPPLEPIQEESEQEDEIKESTSGEEEDENFQVQVGLEREEVVAEDESKEEEEDDGALRSRQLSRSLSRESFLHMQSTFNHWKEMKNFTVPDSTTYSVDLSDEATSPRSPRSEKQKWRSSGKPRVKVSISVQFLLKLIWHHTLNREDTCVLCFKSSKIRKQQHKPLQRSVQKKATRKRHKESVTVSFHFE